mmetsp:Transcript_21355/g.45840  ORF Transcript_21355/g.45840 Transcript_21355/m.45840 type:complete len:259 (-) Transcript_21355:194-970(-)
MPSQFDPMDIEEPLSSIDQSGSDDMQPSAEDFIVARELEAELEAGGFTDDETDDDAEVEPDSQHTGMCVVTVTTLPNVMCPVATVTCGQVSLVSPGSEDELRALQRIHEANHQRAVLNVAASAGLDMSGTRPLLDAHISTHIQRHAEIQQTVLSPLIEREKAMQRHTLARALDTQVVDEKTAQSMKKEDPVSCAICYGSAETGDKVAALPCQHSYHESCILEWLVKSRTCPLCRSKVPVPKRKPMAKPWKGPSFFSTD